MVSNNNKTAQHTRKNYPFAVEWKKNAYCKKYECGEEMVSLFPIQSDLVVSSFPARMDGGICNSLAYALSTLYVRVVE